MQTCCLPFEIDCVQPALSDLNWNSKSSFEGHIKGSWSYEQFLKGALFAFSTDRPSAMVDLGQNIWASTSGNLCKACSAFRKSEKGRESCILSDLRAARRCYDSGGCAIYRCASLGLIDMVLPIKCCVPNEPPVVVAAFLTGQYKTAWMKLTDKEHLRKRFGDIYNLDEVVKAFNSIPWLEEDLEKIKKRILALNSFIKENTEKKCYIEDCDIDSLIYLVRNEIRCDSSLSKLLQKDLINTERINASIMGAEILSSASASQNNRKIMSLWHWGKNWNTGVSYPKFQFQRWALPCDPIVKDNLSPFVSMPNWMPKHAELLAKNQYSKNLRCRDVQTTLKLADGPCSPSPESLLSGNCIRIEAFPDTNPGNNILIESITPDENVDLNAELNEAFERIILQYGDITNQPLKNESWEIARIQLLSLFEQTDCTINCLAGTFKSEKFNQVLKINGKSKLASGAISHICALIDELDGNKQVGSEIVRNYIRNMDMFFSMFIPQEDISEKIEKIDVFFERMLHDVLKPLGANLVLNHEE